MRRTHPFYRQAEWARNRERIDALGFYATLSPNRDDWEVGEDHGVNPFTGFRERVYLAHGTDLKQAIEEAVAKQREKK